MKFLLIRKTVLFFLILSALLFMCMPAFGLSDLAVNRHSEKMINDYRPQNMIPEEVRAIYITGNIVHWPPRFNQLLDFTRESDLNSLVIDMKDDWGALSIRTDNEYINNINPPLHRGGNYAETLKMLNEENIYTIARVVVFKDPHLSQMRPEWSIKNRDGSLWRDRKGITWVDPYNKDVWRYTIEASKEAAKLGFREIQFDYVRFPTDGNTSTIQYDNPENEEMRDVIYNFLVYANEELKDYNVFLSADVFGLTTTTLDDMRIGQQFEMISDVVDYICPMIYPSHYGPNIYGFANPNAHPYGVVLQAMLDGYKKSEGRRAYIRPWLQDFSLGQPRYGVHEVREQIRAVYDSGHSEWIFWNAANRYTEAAYFDTDSLR